MRGVEFLSNVLPNEAIRRRIAEIEAEIIRCSESQSDEAIAADGAARMQLERQPANDSS
jgi:hypothetical protein